jgi:hypothetical protein
MWLECWHAQKTKVNLKKQKRKVGSFRKKEMAIKLDKYTVR